MFQKQTYTGFSHQQLFYYVKTQNLVLKLQVLAIISLMSLLYNVQISKTCGRTKKGNVYTGGTTSN